MTAQEEVQARALKMTERTSKTIEQGRVAVRDADPDLAERERQEERSRTFREPRPAAPERTAAFRQLDIAAQKLMHAHPDKYRTRAAARTRARELDPALKAREITEERTTSTANMSTRLQLHAETDSAGKLKDSFRDVSNEQRDRRESDAAFVEQHAAAIQRRVDAGADTQRAVMDEIRATVLSSFEKLVKGGKPKAASTIRDSSIAATDAVILRMRSGPKGHHLRESLEHVMKSLALAS